jgi:ribosomal-protein-alanine N-acetyltransferase
MTGELVFAPATEADLDAINEVERHSFTTSWPRDTFAQELARPHARVDVARDDRSRVVAFCNYWLVQGELTIHAIATHPDHRGREVASGLLAHVLARGREAGCTIAHLEVRRSNVPALALYARAGFSKAYVRSAYYRDGEDAIVMKLEL